MHKDTRTPEQIKRDIEQTRQRMDRNLEALGDRLSARELVRELSGTDALGAAQRTAKEHPIPLSLMGLGAAWLAAETISGRNLDAETIKRGARGGQQRLSTTTDVGAPGARARNALSEAMESQPLALGALAFGLGLAGGLAAPGTRAEDRWSTRLKRAPRREEGTTPSAPFEEARLSAEEERLDPERFGGRWDPRWSAEA